MRKRRNPLTRGLGLGLALLLALPITGSIALAAPSGDFEQLIAEADAHADAQRHQQALETYIAAFEAMPDELKTSDVGQFVAVAAAKAALADHRERGSSESLEQGRAVLEQFIERATGTEGAASVDPAREQLAEIDQQLEEERPDTEEIEPLPADPEVDPAPVRDATTDAPPQRRGLGIGLIVGGGVAAVAGVGLVVAGVRQVPWYQQQLEAQGWTPDTDGYSEELANARRIRNIDLGLGVALLVVGAGLATGGAVVLARGKKGSEAQASVTPLLGPDGVGLSARLSF